MNLDYHELCKLESAGSYGCFGLYIKVAVHPPRMEEGPQIELDVPAILQDKRVSDMIYEVREKIEDAVRRAAMATMPFTKEANQAQREQLLAGFGSEAIFVEELPNGYCSRWCCAHLPWYKVTTKLGRIVIGWRKRVVNIDWSDTQGTKTSKELFELEDVTKDTRGIHAWSGDKAREYVGAILTGVPITPKT